ncbi:MAG TPA: hypothetical protein VFF72_08840, partial [Caldimonas sp.]|nr:hypothetical protein [Caldimonas sp.]
ADPGASRVVRHDDLDDRPLQIETMNQQLRMEKRRGDSLLHLYPDEAAHHAARLRDLENADKPLRAADERIANLAREQRRLRDASALWAGKALPSELRERSQRVDVALQLERTRLKACREERELVGKAYDDELVVLRRLWAAQGRTVSAVDDVSRAN